MKAAREAKCWSQEHLAEAARLNIRTIQRIEAGARASDETMLSLAAALDVHVTELNRGMPQRRASRSASAGRLALALVLIAPAAVFLLVNLAQALAGISAPYHALATTGGKLMAFDTFNRVSPVIFLGGLAGAVMLCVPALIRLRIEKSAPGVVSISGVELKADWAAAAIATLALLSGAALLGYAGLEALRTQTIG